MVTVASCTKKAISGTRSDGLDRQGSVKWFALLRFNIWEKVRLNLSILTVKSLLGSVLTSECLLRIRVLLKSPLLPSLSFSFLFLFLLQYGEVDEHSSPSNMPVCHFLLLGETPAEDIWEQDLDLQVPFLPLSSLLFEVSGGQVNTDRSICLRYGILGFWSMVQLVCPPLSNALDRNGSQ